MSLHVQDAGDGVPLGEGGKCSDQLPPVVQVAAIGTVQPHVSSSVMVVIFDWPTRNTHTCALIASVLFGDVELRGGEFGIYIYKVIFKAYFSGKIWATTNKERLTWINVIVFFHFVLTFQMKQPDVMAVVARPYPFPPEP